jgi:hypothetical protein
MDFKVIKNEQLQKEVNLGVYKLSIDEGIMYLSKGRQMFIISANAIGFKEITVDARILKIDEETAYVFDRNNKVAVIKPTEEKGQLKINVSEIALPFSLSGFIRCCSEGRAFLLIDLKKKYYIHYDGENINSSNINISERAFPVVSSDIGIIFDQKEVQIINKGIRSVLSVAKAFNQNNIRAQINRERTKTELFFSDGIYELKVSIDKNGKVLYGERSNIFFESKRD